MRTNNYVPAELAKPVYIYIQCPKIMLPHYEKNCTVGTYSNTAKNCHIIDALFEVLTVVMIQVQFFWVVIPCNVVAYQRFRCPRCLHLHFTLKMEAAWSSETFVSYPASQARRTELLTLTSPLPH